MPETEAAQDVAARLAESLIVDFAKDGNENALDIIQREQAQTAPAAVEQPAADEAPEPVAEPAPPFDLNPALPEDLVAELDAAEIDEQVEREVAAYQPEEDEWGNPVEVDTDAVREAIKLRKRNEYLERQLVESKAASWKAEAEKFFPLAKHALDGITATSRRGFLRAAKAEHDRILPHVQGYLAEAKQFVDAEKADVTTEARKQVAESWGQPLAGPDTALNSQQADQQQRVQRARENVREGKGGLAQVFAELMRK